MSRFVVLAVIGLVVPLVSPGESLAGCTPSACNALYYTCRAASRIDRDACRSECKGTAGGSECTRACSDAAKAAMLVCKDGKTACKATCASADPVCASDCSADVKFCANYKTVAKPCMTACKTAFKDAWALCADDPACEAQSWVDFGACYGDCADDVSALGAGCQADFETCIEACGS